jgi:hypothetical protein
MCTCVCVCARARVRVRVRVRVCVSVAGAAKLVPPMIMINSFNEWHDGSEIEPSKEEGESLLNLIAQAHILTKTNMFTRQTSTHSQEYSIVCFFL